MDEFSKFKPVCVSITKQPTVENISKLLKMLHKAKRGTIQELQEYLLFPVFLALSSKETKKEAATIASLNCLQAIFESSLIKTQQIGFDSILQCLLHVYKVGGNSEEFSEEIKLAAVKTLKSVLSASSESLIAELHSKTKRPLFGQLVFTLLKVAVFEQLRELRVESLNCLEDLFNDERLEQETLADSFAEFVPGVVSHLEKVVVGRDRQSQQVTQKGLETFGVFVSLIFCDETCRGESCDSPRNQDFLQKSLPNLSILAERMVQQGASGVNSKLGLVSMATRIVSHCSRTLNELIPLLIRKIIQLSADPEELVRTAAEKSIELFSSLDIDIRSALRQILYDSAISLPRLLATRNFKDHPIALQELEGTLKLIGSDLETTLMFSGIRDKLFRSLLQSAQIEDSIVFKGIHFRYLQDDCSLSHFSRCCRILGYHGNLEDFSLFFMETYESRGNFHRESVFVLNLIVSGASEKDFATLESLTKTYGRELENSSQILAIFFLQGIAEIAKIFAKKFQYLLRFVLKAVLEKAGESTEVLSSAANLTLKSIKESIEIESISELLSQNIDHFAPQLSYQIKDYCRYPNAVNALRALLRLSKIRIQPWLEQTVEKSLKGLDRIHLDNPKPFLEILELFCTSLKRTRTKKTPKNEVLDKSCWKKFMEHVRTFKESMDFDGRDTAEPFGEEKDEPEVEPEEEKIPKAVQLVSEILDRCIHLLTRTDTEETRPLLLSIIDSSVDILSDYENIFLPKVHQLWNPLKTQLLSQDLLTQRQLCEVVILLLEKCPDFLHRNFIHELLPHLLRFLERQAPFSELKGKAAAGNYVFTQAFKLQLLVLRKLGTAVRLLRTDPITTAKILVVTMIYVKEKQLEKLQNAACESISEIQLWDPDGVWIALQSAAQNTDLVKVLC